MPPYLRSSFMIAAILTAAPASSRAQMLIPDFGITAGLNFATFGGKDAAGSDRTTTFMVGASAIFPVNQQFSFQPELLYSRKGAETTELGTTAKIKLAYLDVPLLAKITLPTQSTLKPALYFGPSVGLNVSCDIEVTDPTGSISSSCDDAGFKARSLDVGLIAGAGMDFDNLNFFARYQHGLTNIGSGPDAGDAKNRVITVGARLSLKGRNP